MTSSHTGEYGVWRIGWTRTYMCYITSNIELSAQRKTGIIMKKIDIFSSMVFIRYFVIRTYAITLLLVGFAKRNYQQNNCLSWKFMFEGLWEGHACTYNKDVVKIDGALNSRFYISWMLTNTNGYYIYVSSYILACVSVIDEFTWLFSLSDGFVIYAGTEKPT